MNKQYKNDYDFTHIKNEYNLVLRLIDDGVIGFDSNGKIIFSNPAVEKILGYKDNELTGKSIKEILYNSDSTSDLKEADILHKIFHEKIIISETQQTFVSKDKKTGSFTFTCTPVIKDDKTESALIILKKSTENIETLIQQRTLELEKERKTLLDLFTNTPAIVCLFTGPEHIFEFTNPGYKRLYGYRPLDGLKIRDALPEIEGQGFFELLDDVYQNKKTFVGNEMPAMVDYNNNGVLEEKYFNLIYHPIVGTDDKSTGITVLAVDITEQVMARKKLETLTDTLKESENKYKLLSESLEIQVQQRVRELVDANKEIVYQRNKLNDLFMNAPAYICLLETDKHIFKFINPMYQLLVGNRNIIGKPVREALPEIEGQGLYELLDNVYNTGEAFIGKEVPVAIDKTGDGTVEQTYMNFVYQPVFNIDNQVEGISVFAFEVTEEVLSRQKIEYISKDLEKSNTSLQNFASIASHDLKAPIRTVSSYASLLKRRYKDNLDESANEFIDFIINSSKRLNNMIDDLLEHSKINNQLSSYVKTDFNEIIETVISNLNLTIEDNNAIINYHDLPELEVNPNQMITLFQNLIDNSIKYRSEKQPVINISCSRNEKEYVFSVNDNGLGFNNKFSDRIFDIFQRLHSEQEGTGIGLASVKKIVEMHGGTINVNSEEGVGTTFCFTIPFK